MHYIKEIFLGRPVGYIHGLFVRYGKGTFGGPQLVVKNGPVIKAEGSIHYANVLGELIAVNGSQEFNVSGTINAKREIKVPVEVKKKTSKKGLHTTELKGVVHSDALKMIYGDYRDSYVLLDLNASEGRWKLKSKKKLPKPGGKLDVKFCSAALEQNALSDFMEEVLFDVGDKKFKTAELKHEIVIDELMGSEELKKDPVKYRLEAKRKGKMKRTVTIDGRATETEHEFLV